MREAGSPEAFHINLSCHFVPTTFCVFPGTVENVSERARSGTSLLSPLAGFLLLERSIGSYSTKIKGWQAGGTGSEI